MKTRTEKQVRCEEASELKLLRRNKVKGFKTAQPGPGHRKKRHKVDLEPVIKVLPVSPTGLNGERDPITRVYSEDSA